MDSSKARKPQEDDLAYDEREEAKEEEYDYFFDKKEEENANDAQFYHVMDEADLGNPDDEELMDEEEAKAR